MPPTAKPVGYMATETSHLHLESPEEGVPLCKHKQGGSRRCLSGPRRTVSRWEAIGWQRPICEGCFAEHQPSTFRLDHRPRFEKKEQESCAFVGRAVSAEYVMLHLAGIVLAGAVNVQHVLHSLFFFPLLSLCCFLVALPRSRPRRARLNMFLGRWGR